MFRAFLVIVVSVTHFSSVQGYPWAPEYKMKPYETGRLTAADVVGPDGFVYPDFTRARIPGGIQLPSYEVNLADFGGSTANDDNYSAFNAAIDHLEGQGGGILNISAGTYNLKGSVLITGDNIVIRGSGIDTTTIHYTPEPNLKTGDLWFLNISDGDSLPRDSQLEMVAYPRRMNWIRLLIDGTEVDRMTGNGGDSNTYSDPFLLSYDLNRQSFTPGVYTFTVEANYTTGETNSESINLNITERARADRMRRNPESNAAFSFKGDEWTDRGGLRWNLQQDAMRGDLQITLDTNVEGTVLPNDYLTISHITGVTFQQERSLNVGDSWTQQQRVRVESVSGNVVTLQEPLRFPILVANGGRADGTYFPIVGCGVEDLTIHQYLRLFWTSGVSMSYAAQCWVRDIKVTDIGRHPVVFDNTYQCVLKDSTFIEARYNGGNGTAYVGGFTSTNCLFENLTSQEMRHAPNFNSNSSGNVVRLGSYDRSDIQLHTNWSSENLFEQLVVDARTGTGSYGNGIYVTDPLGNWGPTGPRNVFYNCDIRASTFSSSDHGAEINGSTEGYLFMHNRIRGGEGDTSYGFWFGQSSIDMVMHNNTIILPNVNSTPLYISDTQSVGIEFLNNRIYGGQSDVLTTGSGVPSVDFNNQWFALDENASRPDTRGVDSLYLWQLAKAGITDQSYLIALDINENAGTTLTNSGTIGNDAVVYRSGASRSLPTWENDICPKGQGDHSLRSYGEQTGPGNYAGITLETGASLDNLNEFTFACWFKLNGVPAFGIQTLLATMDYENHPNSGFHIGINKSNTNKPQFFMNVEGDSYFSAVMIDDDFETDWHFIAVGFKDGEMDWYLGSGDQAVEAKGQDTFVSTNTGDGSDTTTIGTIVSNWANRIALLGDLDHVYFTDVRLSEDEMNFLRRRTSATTNERSSVDLSTFKVRNGINGPSDGDGDGDGIPEYLEWAFGGNPFSADAGLLPELDVPSNGQSKFSFLRRIGQEAKYSVEVTTDLSNWSDASGMISEAVQRMDGFEQVTITVDDIESPDAQFFRIGVVD